MNGSCLGPTFGVPSCNRPMWSSSRLGEASINLIKIPAKDRLITWKMIERNRVNYVGWDCRKRRPRISNDIISMSLEKLVPCSCNPCASARVLGGNNTTAPAPYRQNITTVINIMNFSHLNQIYTLSLGHSPWMNFNSGKWWRTEEKLIPARCVMWFIWFKSIARIFPNPRWDIPFLLINLLSAWKVIPWTDGNQICSRCSGLRLWKICLQRPSMQRSVKGHPFTI